MDEEPGGPETRIAPRTVRRRHEARLRTEPVLGRPGMGQPRRPAPTRTAARHQQLRRRAGALVCLLAAIGAVVGAVVLFSGGFAGPAPIALAAAGGFIAVGAALWGTARPAAGIAATAPGNRHDAPRREDADREHDHDD